MGRSRTRNLPGPPSNKEGGTRTNLAHPLTAEWLVSTQQDGEDLAVEAQAGGLKAVAFGASENEIRARLEELLRLADLEPEETESGGKIPPPLRRAVLDLVDWRWQGFGGGGGELAAMVFFSSPEGAGFAHVGGSEPRIRVNGKSLRAPWTHVRDTDGREARACFRSAATCQRIEIEWSPSLEVPGIDAEWHHLGEDLSSAVEESETAAASESAAEPGSAPAEERSASPPAYATGNFFKWLDRAVMGHRAEQRPAAAAAAAAKATEESPRVAPVSSSSPPRPGLAWQPAAPEHTEPGDRSLGDVIDASAEARPGPWPSVLPPAQAPSPVKEPAPVPRAAPPVSNVQPPAPFPGIARAPLSSVAPPAPLSSIAPPAPVPSAASPVQVSMAATPASFSSIAPAPIAPPPLVISPTLEPPLEVEAPNAGPESPSIQPDESGIRTRAARRPSWPSPAELERPAPPWRRWLPTAGVVVLLFAAGWFLGRTQNSPNDSATKAPFASRVLRAIGLGGARFDCVVRSWPDGAWIAVDGKDLGRRTPATLELSPGTHRIQLTLPDLGKAVFTVQGERGARTKLDAPLWGSLSVRAQEDPVPIQVSVDGKFRGFAPIDIKRLAPGPHQVEFSKPGFPPWGQTINVRVSQATELNARVIESPANGLIEVHASLSDEGGVDDLRGAMVWVDGVRRGQTPFTLELPRGPHSFRAEYRGEEAPVQVIDLPGGNQRFATFVFGSGVDRPRLALLSPASPLPRDRPVVMSVALEGVLGTEVREIWMHVRTPEGSWRRYPMTVMSAPGGAVGTAVFPLAMVEADGRTPFYMSAITLGGDEYFTELQNPGKS